MNSCSTCFYRTSLGCSLYDDEFAGKWTCTFCELYKQKEDAEEIRMVDCRKCVNYRYARHTRQHWCIDVDNGLPPDVLPEEDIDDEGECCGFKPLDENKDEKLDENTQGKKFDDGKPSITLLPTEWISGLVDVMMYGAKKYDRDNWKKGIEFHRLYDAAYRHMEAFWEEGFYDEESKLHPLLHAAVDLLMLYWMDLYRKDLDDRPGGSNDLWSL